VPDDVKAHKLYQIMQAVFKVEADKYLGVKEIDYGEKKAEKTEAKAEKKESEKISHKA
jgi:hypothetical protein